MGVKFRPMATFNNKAECINNYLHWQLFALLREISQRQLVKDSLNIIHLNIACMLFKGLSVVMQLLRNLFLNGSGKIHLYTCMHAE